MRTSQLLAVLSLALVPACRQDMHDQPKLQALERSTFFDDERTMRPALEGTVARGHLDEDEHLYAGTVAGQPAETFPFEITRSVLDRGAERYRIYCTPCHAAAGNGEGMVVQRGMKHPPSFHIQRLREAPPGYFFDVMTRGFGAMYDVSDRVSPEDRWAITAYIRALQLSQSATLEDVPQSERAALEATR